MGALQAMVAPDAHLAPELRKIPAFSDLPEEGLQWLVSKMMIRSLRAGEISIRQGDPAEHMIVVLEGEIRSQGDSAGGRAFVVSAGDVTGMLPFSRLTVFPVTSRAVLNSRVALLHKDHFPEMIDRLPVLVQRLVSIMSDRIREVTKSDVQREKMMALGKLSAGLAHELNNPASAARRASCSLREAVRAQREANLRLDGYDLSTEQRQMLSQIEAEIADRPDPSLLDSLERSDCEDRISEWLSTHGVGHSWELAPGLVESGFTTECLDQIGAIFSSEMLEAALIRATASITVGRLASEIENATGRIAELVQAIKEYSYMDQAPIQEVEVHKGIESTLKILRHRLKQGVTVKREYSPDPLVVCAKGSELNQVWTNLIDNAIDAMNGQGELRIRTALELDIVLVEIGDNGPGIPKEIQSRIFEPFFTTKNVGEGTGLGLDAVYRIVSAHRGLVRFDSSPGDTRFQVRIPAAPGLKV